ncbi:hypothetical protein LTR86_008302 [Recurvomyces mirabilis]|nr:hypothetical protein LTR86_008302 [Recurvomyces mirabilis]
MELRCCSRCAKHKPIDHFATTPDNLTKTCAQCRERKRVHDGVRRAKQRVLHPPSKNGGPWKLSPQVPHQFDHQPEHLIDSLNSSHNPDPSLQHDQLAFSVLAQTSGATCEKAYAVAKGLHRSTTQAGSLLRAVAEGSEEVNGKGHPADDVEARIADSPSTVAERPYSEIDDDILRPDHGR